MPSLTKEGSRHAKQQDRQKSQISPGPQPASQQDPSGDDGRDGAFEFQAGGRPRPAEPPQRDHDRRHHEGDGLAAALGPRLLCRCGAQEARLDADVGEGRRRTRLSCDLPGSRPNRSRIRRSPRGRPPSHGFGGYTERSRARSIAFGRSASRSCGANGGGCTTANRRGSAATCLSLHSVTDFRKSSTAGSASRRVASCKRWRRPCGRRAGLAPRRASA